MLLINLTKKLEPEKVNWTVECGSAFDKLKKVLMSYPVLRNVNFSLPFILQIDTSDVGVGAVLSQPDEKNLDHPMAYFSRKLLPREKKFSVIKKECLAIKLGVEAFAVYLIGREFTI